MTISIADLQPPKPDGKFPLTWWFMCRHLQGLKPRYKLVFSPTERFFFGRTFDPILNFRSTKTELLGDDDVEILRSLLPPEAIAECTAAAIRATLPPPAPRKK